MLRLHVPLHGLAFLLVSCAALAQPSPSPTPPAGDAPAAPPAAAPAVPAQVLPSAAAPPLQACAVKAFDDYATNMSVWERQWAEGVIGARPEFTTAAVARANAHNSALQRDGFRIHFLAATAPDSLELGESIASMRLFDWTAEQEQGLRLSQPDYAGVADAADRDRLAADAQPKAQELENYFEESFSDSAGAVWARKLKEVLEKGNVALAQCHRAHPAPAAPEGGPTVETPPVGSPLPEPKAPG